MCARAFRTRILGCLFLLFALRALPAAPTALPGSVDAPHLHVQLVTPLDVLYPGGDNRVGIYFKLEPGWHVYWKNAGDSGEPPRVQWTLPQGVVAGPLQFPAPRRLPLGPLMDFGYENEVLFPVQLQVAQGIKEGKALLDAKINWLVCREVCIPGKTELETILLVLPAAPAAVTGSAIDSDLMNRFAAALPKPAPSGLEAVFQPTGDGFRLAVQTGQKERQAEFFPSDQDILDNPAAQKITPTRHGLILQLAKDASLKSAPAHLNGVLKLSGGRAFEISAEPGTIAAGTFSLVWLPLLQAAALAFGGGLLLNLMPCVFPVLFLKGLALVNSGNEERSKLRAHGLVYAVGILVSFWVLVAVLLGLRTAGAGLGWGFQFQSPVFLSLMAGLLFFLGLSLAGQFEIGLTLTSLGGSLAQRSGWAGSFFTGVLAVIVATPCTAPFMGAAIGYAMAQPAPVVFAVFTALAIGLAVPYLALTLYPAWTRHLPKPGAWMEILRQVISLPVFATVIWLAWVLAQAYGADALARLLTCLLLLAVAGWFLGRWPARRWAFLAASGIVVAVVLFAVFSIGKLSASSASAPSTIAAHGEWEPWSIEAVARYQSQGRPIFVDFSASWCLSCQVNERIALNQPAVQKAFEANRVALLRADWTRHDEAITQALATLDRSGVPAYALYAPGQTAPQMLPEVLTPGIVTAALAKLPRTPNSADGN